MNDERRKRLTKIAEQIMDLKTDLEAIRDEEQEYLDNMPESLQAGDKGTKAEECIGHLDEIIENLEEAEQAIPLTTDK